jgi:uncharacterized protein (TIGR02444 family)
MGDADSQAPSPLWRFSLRFYRSPGVADACLTLQDECGADVNVLLCLLWLGADLRQVGSAEACRLDATLAPWRESVVVPLRSLRRRLKTGVPPVAGNTGEWFRTQIKAIELEAERLEQQSLFALACDVKTTPARSVEGAGRANVAAYEAALAATFKASACDVLVAALASHSAHLPNEQTSD